MVTKDNYIECDVLEQLPTLHRDNYNFETEFLTSHLPQNASVLQVGCMDGTRLLRLHQQRPDLELSGLEIEQDLVLTAQSLLSQHKIPATIIHGDITAPPPLTHYDYVVCLNHTLGYIPDQHKAIEMMKKLGKHVIISVYGEIWTPQLAQEYFKTLKLSIKETHHNKFILSDGWPIHRYTKQQIETWDGKIIKTPLGSLVIFS
ncbi:methyltransferase domain-containing protein [Candidatus Woesearchaeota archaeon]|nr:methyltransferase domain-containing protein [Candidatus Woesearchaeota archaeon]